MSSFDPFSSFIGFISSVIVVIAAQYIQRKFETHTLKKCLRVEITQIQHELDDFKKLLALEGDKSQVIKDNMKILTGTSNVPDTYIFDRHFEIYKNNTSKLGLFSANLAALLIQYYGAVRFIKQISEFWAKKVDHGNPDEKRNTLSERCDALNKLTDGAMEDGETLKNALSNSMLHNMLNIGKKPTNNYQSSFRKALEALDNNQEGSLRMKKAVRIMKSD
jgi:hypothetical protein